MTIRVGTRGSALATTQTGHVVQRLQEITGRPVDTVLVRTDGDVLTGSLASMGGTGVFVVALREALLDGRCDIAVHSLKDLPTGEVDGLTIITPERVDPRDVLCGAKGATLAGLSRGARVGTGSPRRAAQLRAVRPDLDVVDIRGNVDTRLGRATGENADLDAVVLAYAGLARLDRLDAVSEVLDTAIMAPAPGQGALAVEVRTDVLADQVIADALAQLDHPPTHWAVIAERAVLARLEAGCAAPVGAYAVVDDGALSLTAVVARVDGAEVLTHTARADLPQIVTGTEAETAAELGLRVAEALLADGAAALAPVGRPEDAPEPPPTTGALNNAEAVAAARESLRDGGLLGGAS